MQRLWKLLPNHSGKMNNAHQMVAITIQRRISIQWCSDGKSMDRAVVSVLAAGHSEFEHAGGYSRQGNIASRVQENDAWIF